MAPNYWSNRGEYTPSGTNDIDALNSLEVDMEKELTIIKNRLDLYSGELTKNKFSIDALIKSISNYIKDEREFNDWYTSQSIWKHIWWKIKKYSITYIRQNFYNK